jgi:hypothetical protein
MRLLPKTCAGWWASGLSLIFIILIAIKIQFWLPLPTFVIAALGSAGFIFGLMAIFKNEDRTILNLLSIISGIAYFAVDCTGSHIPSLG